MIDIKFKELEKYRDLIIEVSDERSDHKSMNDGIWIYLKDGCWLDGWEVSQIHENTLLECLDRLEHVTHTQNAVGSISEPKRKVGRPKGSTALIKRDKRLEIKTTLETNNRIKKLIKMNKEKYGIKYSDEIVERALLELFERLF